MARVHGHPPISGLDVQLFCHVLLPDVLRNCQADLSLDGRYVLAYPFILCYCVDLPLRVGAHLLPNSMSMSFGSLFAGSVDSLCIPNFSDVFLLKLDYVEHGQI